MKKTNFLFTLILFAIGLFGCGNEMPTQSNFKANFSLDAIVEANEHLLLDEARSSSGTETGLREPFIQNYEEMTIQIDQANMSEFLTAVRTDVERAIIDSDAQMLGSEGGSNDTEHFSFSYSEDAIQGTIHVWGVPGEDTDFTIIALITES